MAQSQAEGKTSFLRVPFCALWYKPRLTCLGFWVKDLEFQASGLGFEVFGFIIEIRIDGLDLFRVHGSGVFACTF